MSTEDSEINDEPEPNLFQMPLLKRVATESGIIIERIDDKLDLKDYRVRRAWISYKRAAHPNDTFSVGPGSEKKK